MRRPQGEAPQVARRFVALPSRAGIPARREGRSASIMSYAKPVVLAADDLAEGVYMGSGCYTANAQITQTPETGRENYCIQVNGAHHGDHTTNHQTLYLVFNQQVQYVSSQGSPVISSGTTIAISYGYHNNPTDNVGLGDVYVTSDPGLSVVKAYIIDNDN
jgi:hypothetical protein